MNLLEKNTPISRLCRTAAVTLSAAAILTFAPAAQASGFTGLVNGSFESLTDMNGKTVTTGGQLGYNVQATGWNITGYNFLYTSGSADTTGQTGNSGNVKLWGPGDGSNNGLPASSPDGGNYVAADGAYQVGAISQTLTGLTAGTSYSVAFWWAGAQQSGFTGPNTEQWQVSFGNSTQSTAVVNNASKGFTGWQKVSMNFVADSTTDVLSFLAVGTPSGQPPFSLLDGVSVTQLNNSVSSTPEPGSIVLMLSGLASGIGAIRSRRKKQ